MATSLVSGEAGIDFRGADFGVAHPVLQRPHRHPGAGALDAERVAQAVEGDATDPRRPSRRRQSGGRAGESSSVSPETGSEYALGAFGEPRSLGAFVQRSADEVG
jgi:hypothetical protein